MATGRVEPPTSQDFAAMVDGLLRRDHEAEAALFTYFGPRILMLARREGQSAATAEDVRSETLMRVITAVRDQRLREAAALPGFVLQTARHVIHELRRRDRCIVSLEDTAAEPAATPIEPADPHAVDALRVALTQLSDRDRAFLQLYYYEELSRDEIARRLGIAADRVRLVKSRALQRFREAYAEVTRR